MLFLKFKEKSLGRKRYPHFDFGPSLLKRKALIMTQQAIKEYLKELPRKQTNSLFRMFVYRFRRFFNLYKLIRIISNIFHLIIFIFVTDLLLNIRFQN